MNTMNTMNTHNILILVNTTNGADIPAGYVQLSANQRETKDKELNPAQRYRNILIPELLIGDATQDKFKPVLLSALYQIAKERFEQDMEQSNRLATTVTAQDYTIDGILSFYATDAKSGRMTKEMVTEWFIKSLTGDKVKNKAPEKFKAYSDNYAKLASPNHGLNPNTCRALLATLVPEDLTNPIATAIASKLQSTITKSEASQVEAL